MKYLIIALPLPLFHKCLTRISIHATTNSHPGSSLPISLPSKYRDLPFFALRFATSRLVCLAFAKSNSPIYFTEKSSFADDFFKSISSNKSFTSTSTSTIVLSPFYDYPTYYNLYNPLDNAVK